MRPRLIHPRKVRLYKRRETDIDPEFGPTGKVEWEKPVILNGQVKYDKYQRAAPIGSGNDPASDGHVVFHSEDWVSSGGKVGDEMELEVDFVEPSRLVVTEVRPAAHYRGIHWHVHVFFQRKRTVSK